MLPSSICRYFWTDFEEQASVWEHFSLASIYASDPRLILFYARMTVINLRKRLVLLLVVVRMEISKHPPLRSVAVGCGWVDLLEIGKRPALRSVASDCG